MKTRYLLLIVSFFIIGMLSAQRHSTLLGRSPLNGAFGAPIYEFTVKDGIQGGVGGGGGLVFRNFFLGAYGVASLNGLEDILEIDDLNKLDLSHGGLWLGYTPFSYSVIHPYSSVRAGWGVLDLDFDDPDLEFDDLDQVYVITPELGIEINITKWFRVAGTAGYRHIAGVNDNTPTTVTDSLNGFIGGVTLRFGWFGNNRRNNWNSDWDKR